MARLIVEIPDKLVEEFRENRSGSIPEDVVDLKHGILQLGRVDSTNRRSPNVEATAILRYHGPMKFSVALASEGEAVPAGRRLTAKPDATIMKRLDQLFARLEDLQQSIAHPEVHGAKVKRPAALKAASTKKAPAKKAVKAKKIKKSLRLDPPNPLA